VLKSNSCAFKTEVPLPILKVVNVHLFLLEVHVSCTYVSITLMVDLPWKALSAIPVFYVDQLCLGGAA